MEKSKVKNVATKVKMGATRRVRQAWNWSKDHWAELILGGLAIGGGAYLLTRNKGEDAGEQPQTSGSFDYDTSDVDARIRDAWDACDKPDVYEGPTED